MDTFSERNIGKVCVLDRGVCDFIFNVEKILVCSGFLMFIHSELTWKCTKVVSFHLDGISPEKNELPHVIGELEWEITLKGSLPPEAINRHENSKMINRGCLEHDAFKPKVFRIQVEDGHFPGNYSSDPNDKPWTNV